MSRDDRRSWPDVVWRPLALVVLIVGGLAGCRSWERQQPVAQSRPQPAPSTTASTRPQPTTTERGDVGAAEATVEEAPEADPPPGRRSAGAGTKVGTASYPVPDGAIVVSPSGRDGNAGTTGAPLRTVGAAVSKARSGGTIVLRAGTYHEDVVIPPDKRLTIQSWPREAVWFDGSTSVTGWSPAGGRWQKDGWRTEFDASPTFTRGAKDHTAEGWRFINPEHPMAAHPDQIWINGVPQLQVRSLDEVRRGTFFHDRRADRLFLGTDPSGKEVRVSVIQRALAVRSRDSVLRGFGVRRYAPSVPDMGSVTLEEAGIDVEHVAITESATTGLFVSGSDVGLRNLHLARNGMIGVLADEADKLVAERVLAEENNVERFNASPSAGGMKVTTSRHATVRDSVFRSNKGSGLWFDVSSYDGTIVGCEMQGNENHGISLEISAKMLVANNVIAHNRANGVKVNNTSDVAIWNNTITGNERSIWLVQDKRQPSASSPDRDRRRPFPDPSMTWRIGPGTVHNNILASQRSGGCLLCIEDQTKQRAPDQMGIATGSNLLKRPDAEEVTALSVDDTASSAQPLPPAVAGATGVAAGTRHYGAWIR